MNTEKLVDLLTRQCFFCALPFLVLWVWLAVRKIQKETMQGAGSLIAGSHAVLFLRPFSSDRVRVEKQGWQLPFSSLIPYPRLEEVIVQTLWSRVGPVLAIELPHRGLPELGAARIAVGDEWKVHFIRYSASAKLLVIMEGKSPGVLHELTELAGMRSQKSILIILGIPHAYQEFREILCNMFKISSLPPQCYLLFTPDGSYWFTRIASQGARSMRRDLDSLLRHLPQ